MPKPVSTAGSPPELRGKSLYLTTQYEVRQPEPCVHRCAVRPNTDIVLCPPPVVGKPTFNNYRRFASQEAKGSHTSEIQCLDRHQALLAQLNPFGHWEASRWEASGISVRCLWNDMGYFLYGATQLLVGKSCTGSSCTVCSSLH